MTELQIIMALAAIASSLVGSGAVLWYQRREFNQNKADNAELKQTCSAMSSRMDCFEKSQAACQISNTKEFATKKDISHLWERVDENSQDIATIKGRLEK